VLAIILKQEFARPIRNRDCNPGSRPVLIPGCRQNKN